MSPALAGGFSTTSASWEAPRCPTGPARSDPLTALHVLEELLTLPVTEEHRKEGGRKGDKQIESGAQLPGQGLDKTPEHPGLG